MEIKIKDCKDREKIKQVELEEYHIHEVVDITVKCPNCNLEYIDRNNSSDVIRYIECDRCGTRYKYKYNWL